MKRKWYVFKSDYKTDYSVGTSGLNILTLIATFEADAEKDAKRFVSGTGGNYVLYLWDGGGVNVEEAKQ